MQPLEGGFMKKVLLSALLIGSFAFTGCGNFQQTSISEYYNVAASSSTDNAIVYYSITSVDNTISTGYFVTQTLPTLTYTLTTRAKEISPTNTTVLPQITYDKMKVVYSVVGDTGGIVEAGWAPASVETGVSIVVPGTTGSTLKTAGSSKSVTLGNIASTALAAQVLSKVGSVTATVNGSGNYAFNISLRTILTIRADVTLSGTDERSKAVALTIPVTITFATKTS